MNNTISGFHKSRSEITKQVIGLQTEYINLIKNRLGIIIHKHQASDFVKTIANACEKFESDPQKFLKTLTVVTTHSPQFEYVISNITVGETYFFRDKNQMNFIQNIFLPNIIDKKRKAGNLTLRIWSAGCASGEELYTIAIMIKEMISNLEQWNINLLGTDINEDVLKKAINGQYSEWSMRSITPYYKNKYFSSSKNQYRLIQDIKDMAIFNYLNLNDDAYPSISTGTNAQDLILCRNVLIYFDSTRIANIMNNFNDCLLPGAYLILGSSDPIDIKSTELTLHSQYGTIFSRNEMQPNEDEVIDETPVSPKTIIKPFRVTKKTETPPQEINLKLPTEKTLKDMLQQSKWHDILAVTHSMPSQKYDFAMHARATALANLGQIEEAARLFELCIEHHPSEKLNYYTYGLTLIELNRLTEAELALKKAIFLDREFVVAHYQLGLLLLRMKQQPAGIKCLQNALNIAKTHDSAQVVQGSYELNYGRLTEILEVELELYSAAKKVSHDKKDT